MQHGVFLVLEKFPERDGGFVPQTGTQWFSSLGLQLGFHLVPDLCESTASSLWIEIISKDKLSKPLPASLTYTETPTGVKDEVLHLQTD